MTKDEALRLALEYVELVPDDRYSAEHIDQDALITAIKAALEAKDEPAPVAKNEGGRITWMIDDWPQNCLLYTHLPKQEAKDEPWSPVSIGVDVTKEGTHVIAMRLRPNGVNEVIYSQFHPLSRQEAKDEPVVWNEGVPAMLPKQKEGETFIVSYEPKLEAKDEPVVNTDHVICPNCVHQFRAIPQNVQKLMLASGFEPPFTTPPQRTWVGLTDEEIDVIYEQHHNQYGECESVNWGYERAIEAKLKEKNT